MTCFLDIGLNDGDIFNQHFLVGILMV